MDRNEVKVSAFNYDGAVHKLSPFLSAVLGITGGSMNANKIIIVYLKKDLEIFCGHREYRAAQNAALYKSDY